jgi:hypothetical protein
MHYKNGREAKNGDKVVLVPSYGPPMIGILYDATPGNNFCNGRLAVVSTNDPCPNLTECLHLYDVLSAVAKFTAYVDPSPDAGPDKNS